MIYFVSTSQGTKAALWVGSSAHHSCDSLQISTDHFMSCRAANGQPSSRKVRTKKSHLHITVTEQPPFWKTNGPSGPSCFPQFGSKPFYVLLTQHAKDTCHASFYTLRIGSRKQNKGDPNGPSVPTVQVGVANCGVGVGVANWQAFRASCQRPWKNQYTHK